MIYSLPWFSLKQRVNKAFSETHSEGQYSNLKLPKITRRCPSSVDDAELSYFRSCFAEDGKEMYKDL